nr:Chain A, Minor ampullate fibroin 1 [Trichonephila antipodiana]2M0M_B Chain B, Minor ampullate fibroin 1 [Trichonephila antipodiana]
VGTTVASTTSRLSTAEASSRISTAASTLVSGGYLNTAALPSVIADLFAQVGASSPGVSDSEVLIQVLLEIVSSLIHILSSSSVGQVDFSSVGSSAAAVGQSMQVVMG